MEVPDYPKGQCVSGSPEGQCGSRFTLRLIKVEVPDYPRVCVVTVNPKVHVWFQFTLRYTVQFQLTSRISVVPVYPKVHGAVPAYPDDQCHHVPVLP